MHVIAPREKWTDDRLDQLSMKVDSGFAHVDKRFDKFEARFDKLEARFDKLIFALFGVGGALIVTLIGLLGTALL